MVSEKIHFFWKNVEKMSSAQWRGLKNGVLLASDYNEMFWKQIEHKKTKILQKNYNDIFKMNEDITKTVKS